MRIFRTLGVLGVSLGLGGAIAHAEQVKRESGADASGKVFHLIAQGRGGGGHHGGGGGGGHHGGGGGGHHGGGGGGHHGGKDGGHHGGGGGGGWHHGGGGGGYSWGGRGGYGRGWSGGGYGLGFNWGRGYGGYGGYGLGLGYGYGSRYGYRPNYYYGNSGYDNYGNSYGYDSNYQGDDAPPMQLGPESLRPGDKIMVVEPDTALMRGQKLVARIPQGERLAVYRVEGPWIGTSVTRDGQRLTGWVFYQSVVPVQPTDAMGSERAPLAPPQPTPARPDAQVPARPLDQEGPSTQNPSNGQQQ